MRSAFPGSYFGTARLRCIADRGRERAGNALCGRVAWSECGRQVLVAGDSANDLAMFEISSQGIVVGNARAELREAVERETAYQASGCYASGGIEGLRHWGVIPPGEQLDKEVCESFE